MALSQRKWQMPRLSFKGGNTTVAQKRFIAAFVVTIFTPQTDRQVGS
jgi:hypothetical protein